DPLDDKVFTLAGMNIAPGTVIAGQQPDGQSKASDWTGEAIVDHVNPTFSATRPTPDLGRRTWLIAAAVLFAVLATAALALYWRRGRKPKAA
ncbi:MAG TPA: hypothetical protein VFW33_01810, partial [Gemmataceae bacterium]|nr:hypothetical protein [Gemmataceae bacterium]